MPSTVDAVQGLESEPKFVIRRVGVVGLGHMGHAFAANLVEDGYQLFVYDRDPERSATLAGARPVVRLGDLGACDVVLTSLPDDDALAAVALGPAGLVATLSPDAVHISTSTVSPAMSRRVAEEHARRSQNYIAAPGTLTSRGRGSFLFSRRARVRRWKRSDRCSSGWGSGSL